MKDERNDLIVQAMEETLKSDDVASLASELGEIAIDRMLTDEVIRDIPIVGVLIGLFKAGWNIRDALFIKKTFVFLSEIKDVSHEEREKFFLELSKHADARDKLFEKILMAVEKLDDMEKAKILGKAFMHVIKGNLTILEYHRISHILQYIIYEDLRHFLDRCKPGSLIIKETGLSFLTAVPELVQESWVRAGLLSNKSVSTTGSQLLEITWEADKDFTKESPVQ